MKEMLEIKWAPQRYEGAFSAQRAYMHWRNKCGWKVKPSFAYWWFATEFGPYGLKQQSLLAAYLCWMGNRPVSAAHGQLFMRVFARSDVQGV